MHRRRSCDCRTREGSPVRVTKPEYLLEEEHEAVVNYYEDMYRPIPN